MAYVCIKDYQSILANKIKQMQQSETHISHTGALRGLFLPRWTGALVFYRYCRYGVFDFGLQDFSGHPQHSLDMDGASQVDFRIYGSESQASSRRHCASAQTIFLRNLSRFVKICQDLLRSVKICQELHCANRRLTTQGARPSA